MAISNEQPITPNLIMRKLLFTAGALIVLVLQNGCSANYTVAKGPGGDWAVVLSSFPQNGENVTNAIQAYYNFVASPQYNRDLSTPIPIHISNAIVLKTNPYPLIGDHDTCKIRIKTHASVELSSGQSIDSDFVDDYLLMYEDNAYKFYSINLRYPPWNNVCYLGSDADEVYQRISKPGVKGDFTDFVSLKALLWGIGGAFNSNYAGYDPSRNTTPNVDLSSYKRLHECVLSRPDFVPDL